MKIIFLLNEKLKNPLTPRDVRNLIGGCLPDSKIKDRVMNKYDGKHKQSKFIYPRPNFKALELIDYSNDMEAFEEICKYMNGKVINIKGNNSKINSIRVKEYDYVMPRNDLCVYKTKSPIIVTANSVEHKICFNKQKNGEMTDWLKQTIEKLTKLQLKDIFNHELEFDDLEIKLLEHNMVTVSPHKEKDDNRYFQGIYCTFISNYELPEFLGYKTGLGYGRIEKASLGI